MNIKEAENTKIFYIEDGKIVNSSLYSYLCEFGQGDDTSAVEEIEKSIYTIDGSEFESLEDAQEYAERNELDEDLIEEKTKILYRHVVRYHSRKIKSVGWVSENEEEVEEEFLQGLKWFVSEKNWDAPEYFSSYEEAENKRIAQGAELMSVDEEVFMSIDRKQKLVDARRKQIQEINSAKWEAERTVVFEKYKNIISKINDESYADTQSRLASALPEKINGSVFHKIIKSVRNQ